MDPEEINPEEFDPLSDLPEGMSGFLEAFLALEKLISEEYEFVDISLILREKFGEELTEKVLSEAKAKGIL